MNVDAIVGLAISTAFFRSDFDNQTTPTEVEDQNAWASVAELATEYLGWTDIDVDGIKIDKYKIAKAIWGKDKEDLDKELSES